jgi:hypothetical protein
MLDLAISEDVSLKGETIILTNHGHTMRAPGWPQDCDFRLVGFAPSATACGVVWTEQLAQDIGMALKTLREAQALAGNRPDWYQRLARYAEGAV